MRSNNAQLLLRGIVVAFCAVALLLSCRLPQPPADTSQSPLTSPLSSPLVDDSPLPKPKGGGDDGIAWLPFVGGDNSTGEDGHSGWTLVILAGAAGLLFVATAAVVFIVIRGLPKKRRSPAAPGAPVALAEGELLTEGTILGEGRFLVLGIRETSEGKPAYDVKSTLPLDLCPYCFHIVADAAGDRCAQCGRPLPEYRPEHPVLVAHECSTPDAFRPLARLAEHGSRQGDAAGGTPTAIHRAVVTPIAAFKETALDPPRYFVVVPEVSERLSDALPAPRLDLALGWGVTLAQGLEALHEQGYAFTDIGPDRVQIDAGEARWLCFSGMTTLSTPAAEADRRQRADNVQGLVRLLLEAMPEPPDAVRRVLRQAGRAGGRVHAGDLAVALATAHEDLLERQPVRHATAACSDVGRLRKHNEDSLWVQDLAERLPQRATALSFIAVADGVGGHAAGDVASRLTVAALGRKLEALVADLAGGGRLDAPAWIAEAALSANEAVLTERQEMESDMGSTLVMGLIAGTHATLLNVGDSRAYWLRPSGIQQVTKDHSLVQRLVDIGQLTLEEARHHPQKSVIYRVMGDTLQLSYDVFELDLAPGEALLLCSDGLSDLVEDRVLWQTWRDAPDLQVACDQLVELANQGGGYDNITVVMAQIET